MDGWSAAPVNKIWRTSFGIALTRAMIFIIPAALVVFGVACLPVAAGEVRPVRMAPGATPLSPAEQFLLRHDRTQGLAISSMTAVYLWRIHRGLSKLDNLQLLLPALLGEGAGGPEQHCCQAPLPGTPGGRHLPLCMHPLCYRFSVHELLVLPLATVLPAPPQPGGRSLAALCLLSTCRHGL